MKGLAFLGAAIVSAGLAGLLLGGVGSFVPTEHRIAVATMLSAVALAIGGLELVGFRIQMLQCDRETPQRWMHLGSLTGAARNGWALGAGLSTRIGFPLWYVIPIAALLSGSPLLGLALYGAYGASRGLSLWVLMALRHLRTRHYIETNSISYWLFQRAPTARQVGAVHLVILGATALAVTGF